MREHFTTRLEVGGGKGWPQEPDAFVSIVEQRR